jgi:hypothetical protein
MPGAHPSQIADPRRPWLFLDVDGVVSPIPPPDQRGHRNRIVPAGYRTWPKAMWDVYVHEDLAVWGRELDSTFEVIWTTDWQEHAAPGIGDPAGLPTWPHLPLSHQNLRGMRSRVAHKAVAIMDLLERDPRPFGWIDDHLFHGGPKRVQEIELPTLLLRPNKYTGITREHVDALLTFAARAA